MRIVNFIKITLVTIHNLRSMTALIWLSISSFPFFIVSDDLSAVFFDKHIKMTLITVHHFRIMNSSVVLKSHVCFVTPEVCLPIMYKPCFNQDVDSLVIPTINPAIILVWSQIVDLINHRFVSFKVVCCLTHVVSTERRSLSRQFRSLCQVSPNNKTKKNPIEKNNIEGERRGRFLIEGSCPDFSSCCSFFNL